jgi:hypothetical protein
MAIPGSIRVAAILHWITAELEGPPVMVLRGGTVAMESIHSLDPLGTAANSVPMRKWLLASCR